MGRKIKNEGVISIKRSRKLSYKCFQLIFNYFPIEIHLNKICEKEICLSPLPSLSIHVANANSIFGISPYIDINHEWEKNKI